MKLQNISIQNLPGFDSSFIVDNISSQMNIIVGPNGIGKSSLVRALRLLLSQPQSDDPPIVSLAATFQSKSGDQWKVVRQGKQIYWECNGQASERPDLPTAESLNYYLLSVENLYQSSESDEHLVKELKRSINGGFDIDSLRDLDEYKSSARRENSAIKELIHAQSYKEKVERDYGFLIEEEQNLFRMEKEIKKNSDAGIKRDLYLKGIELVSLRKDRQILEKRLSVLPIQMAYISGKELGKLENIEVEEKEIHSKMNFVKHDLDRLTNQLNEIEETYQFDKDLNFEVWEKNISHIKVNGKDLSTVKEGLDQVLVKEKQILQTLGNLGVVPNLSPEAISYVENLARQFQQVQLHADETAAKIDAIVTPPTAEEVKNIEEGIEALKLWQVARKDAKAISFWFILLASFAGLGVAIYSGLEKQWENMTGGIVCFVLALLGGVLSRYQRQVQAQKKFGMTKLDDPDKWEEDQIDKYIQILTEQVSVMQLKITQAFDANRIEADLKKIEIKLHQLNIRKQDFCEKYGITSEMSLLALDRFVRLVSEYDQVCYNKAILLERLEKLKKDQRDRTERVKQFIVSLGVSIEQYKHMDEIEIILAQVKNIYIQLNQLKEDKKSKLNDLRHLEQKFAYIVEEKGKLYDEAQIERGQKADLAKCHSFLSEYQELSKNLTEKKSQESYCYLPLVNKQNILGLVDTYDLEQLHRLSQESDEAAKRVEALKQESAAIRRALKDAGKGFELEQAEFQVSQKAQVVDDLYDEFIFSSCSNFLMDQIKEEYQSHYQPEVLKDAKSRFASFTNFQYELFFDENDGIKAFENHSQRYCPLSSLSLGTRMQLLLATRMAWLKKVEEKTQPIPVFLDEALTTTDETRYQQVVQSLQSVANEEQRQIFYITARYQELQLWQKDSEVHILDMQQIRGAGEAVIIPNIEMTNPVQRNLEMPIDDYLAQLNIPAIQYRSVGQIHIYYLLHDRLELMRDLIETWNINNLGQLSSLAGSRYVQKVFDQDTIRLIQKRIKITESWMEQWLIGRGEDIDRSVLEASGAISEKFIDEVANLAASLGGEGKHLIDKLNQKAVSGFRQAKINELEQWLKDQSYIDDRDILSSEQREHQALVQAAHYVGDSDARYVIKNLEKGLLSS